MFELRQHESRQFYTELENPLLLLHKFCIFLLLPWTPFGGCTKALELGTMWTLVILMREQTTISPSIPYLFLLSFDSFLNIPVNNEYE